MSLDVLIETEWYENVRNGDQYLCDRCSEVVNIDEFRYNRNNKGVYCTSCRNWIEIKRWKCSICNSNGTHRSTNEILLKNCCGKEVSWYQ